MGSSPAGASVAAPAGLVVLVFVATVAAVLLRPFRLHEAWFAVAGAALLAALGAVGWADGASVLRETAGVLAFLAGVLVAGAVAERAGVFTLAALWTARLTGQSARRLFVGVYLLGAVVTTLFSLDATAVVLTPIVFNVVRHAGLPPLPFVFVCTYAANTPSMLLPVSNLTNLLVQARFGLPFWQFARVMALPELLASGANLGMLWVLLRGRLHGQLDVDALELQVRALSRSGFLRWSLVLLAAMLAGFGVAGAKGWPLWGVAVAGGGALAALALARREVRPAFLVRGVSWGLLPFVVGLFLVIRGVENVGVAGQFLTAVVERPAQAAARFAGATGPTATRFAGGVAGEAGGAVSAPSSGDRPAAGSAGADSPAARWPHRVALAVAAAVGSNLINNIPMTLLGMTAAGGDPLAPYALLLGVNIGPNLSVVGSLATMLALGLVRQRGTDVGGWPYLRMGLVVMPVSLSAGLAGLWLAERLGWAAG